MVKNQQAALQLRGFLLSCMLAIKYQLSQHKLKNMLNQLNDIYFFKLIIQWKCLKINKKWFSLNIQISSINKTFRKKLTNHNVKKCSTKQNTRKSLTNHNVVITSTNENTKKNFFLNQTIRMQSIIKPINVLDLFSHFVLSWM